MSDPVYPKIGVLERNKVAGPRIARVISAAAGLAPVAVCDDPRELRQQLEPDATLLACDAADLDLALDWIRTRYTMAGLICWTSEPQPAMLKAMVEEPRFSSLLGWPGFMSMPRPWELTLCVRRLVGPPGPGPGIADLLAWGASTVKWRPRTSADRDHVASDVARWAGQVGANERMAERISSTGYELLMNAMYDAPVDDDGRPRYALDRKQEISLDDKEIPTLRMGSDGVIVAVEVIDVFGGLKRRNLLGGVLRGLAAGKGAAQEGQQAREQEVHEVIDTSHGGAGLGFFKIYSSASVLLTEVRPGELTRVIAMWDIDLNPRQLRALPVSIHLMDGGGRR